MSKARKEACSEETGLGEGGWGSGMLDLVAWASLSRQRRAGQAGFWLPRLRQKACGGLPVPSNHLIWILMKKSAFYTSLFFFFSVLFKIFFLKVELEHVHKRDLSIMWARLVQSQEFLLDLPRRSPSTAFSDILRWSWTRIGAVGSWLWGACIAAPYYLVLTSWMRYRIAVSSGELC